MIIVDMLKNYNNILADIKMLNSRVEFLKGLLQLNDLADVHYYQHKLYAKGLYANPTQSKAINLSINNSAAKKDIQKEIEKSNAVLLDKNYSIKLIKNALSVLSDVNKHIIECIYFNKMNYMQIVLDLQNPDSKFRKINGWCKNTIIYRHNKAITDMENVIDENFSSWQLRLYK